MIIGITGFNGAGKTTVVEYLEKKNFSVHSLSDVLRDLVRQEGKETTRENLIEKGNELREKHGHGILGQLMLKQLQEDMSCVIDSIRHPAEVEELQSRKDFVLVAIEAPTEIRLERMMDRKRDEGEMKYEDIIAFEQEEIENEEEHKQQLSAVSRMAQVVLMNDRDLDVLYKKIDRMVRDLAKKYTVTRPSWDNYCMDMAKVVAKRSNCLKQKTASLIVKDKTIISMGYSGTPRKTTNCNEGGCPACATFQNTLTTTAACLCSHGEENALVRAAYQGVSLKESTLYSTVSPCLSCAKMIINAGIVELVYNKEYPLQDVVFALFQEAGISVRPCLV